MTLAGTLFNAVLNFQVCRLLPWWRALLCWSTVLITGMGLINSPFKMSIGDCLAFGKLKISNSFSPNPQGLTMNPQCLCSDAKPEGNSDESQCTYECAGDSSIKMCGGFGFISIFHTDNTTTDGSTCGNTTQDTYYQKWFTDMDHCGILNTTSESGNWYAFLWCKHLYTYMTWSLQAKYWWWPVEVTGTHTLADSRPLMITPSSYPSTQTPTHFQRACKV